MTISCKILVVAQIVCNISETLKTILEHEVRITIVNVPMSFPVTNGYHKYKLSGATSTGESTRYLGGVLLELTSQLQFSTLTN